jgi:serine protease Do
MALATDLARFFAQTNVAMVDGTYRYRTIGDFMRHMETQQQVTYRQTVVLATIQQMVNLGGLQPHGSSDEPPPLNSAYLSIFREGRDAEYGTWDFRVGGFPLIFQRFSKSVRPVVVRKPNDDEDIGSGFLIEENRFVTAGHCVQSMLRVEIRGWVPTEVPVRRIIVPTDDEVDLAVIEFEAPPFPDAHALRLGFAQVLEPVLVLGYPQIPGFDAIQVAETGEIVAQLKASTGKIVAFDQAYLTGNDYFLINARIKGGSSGGPVIDSYGKVAGIITDWPMLEGKPDAMGYGVVTPWLTLVNLLQAAANGTAEARELPFTMDADRLRTFALP